jgi:hypothetical protein
MTRDCKSDKIAGEKREQFTTRYQKSLIARRRGDTENPLEIAVVNNEQKTNLFPSTFTYFAAIVAHLHPVSSWI